MLKRYRFTVDNSMVDRGFPPWHGVDMERIGELFERLPEVKALAKVQPVKPPKPAPQITLQSERFIEGALAISEAPDKVERAYMARQLVQCTLPHSNPGNVERWLRRNGNAVLVIQAGWNAHKDCSYGYPFGVIPRLLMFWMVTEAVQTKKRRLELGQSLSSFMQEIGLDPNTGGGKRSDAKRLREQLERLFRARISFDVKKEKAGLYGEAWLDMQVGTRGEFWWDIKEPMQNTLWGSWVELGEAFFQAITEAPIPADMRALRLLKRSPLALDLYTLSIHKAFVANKHTQGQFLTWKGLLQQLGAEYDEDRIRNFRAKVTTMMRRVHLAFPSGLKYTLDKEGLSFLPGTRLPVPPRSAALA